MSPARKRNIGHSIIEQLHNHAKANNEDFGYILARYGVERLLYRLSQSPYANDFVLKGAQLFILWKGRSYRVTKDADLLGSVPPTQAGLQECSEAYAQRFIVTSMVSSSIPNRFGL